MKDKVINAAGRVWSLLGEKGSLSLNQVVEASKEKEEIVYQAVGWLAREDKIQYARKGTRTMISLTDAEQQAYKFYRESSLV